MKSFKIAYDYKGQSQSDKGVRYLSLFDYNDELVNRYSLRYLLYREIQVEEVMNEITNIHRVYVD